MERSYDSHILVPVSQAYAKKPLIIKRVSELINSLTFQVALFNLPVSQQKIQFDLHFSLIFFSQRLQDQDTPTDSYIQIGRNQ